MIWAKFEAKENRGSQMFEGSRYTPAHIRFRWRLCRSEDPGTVEDLEKRGTIFAAKKFGTLSPYLRLFAY
jgi:hypothetical protein